MKAGNIYNITLINSLGPENANNSLLKLNEFRNPNHTNIHTHGLHVSPEPGGDYIFHFIGKFI